MLKIMIGLSDVIPGDCEEIFSDIKKDDWACKYATAGVQNDFIAKNERFRPDDTISKTEVLKMILRARNIEVPERTDWQSAYVEVALEKGFIEQVFIDYDTSAKRGFVFEVGAKSL